jgi:O-antigen ligase
VRFGLAPLAADNQYFAFALELGVAGLLLHVAILLGILTAGVRAFRTAPSETSRSSGLLIAVTAVGILINAMTAAVMNSMMLTYVFLWLAGATITVMDRGAATASSA